MIIKYQAQLQVDTRLYSIVPYSPDLTPCGSYFSLGPNCSDSKIPKIVGYDIWPKSVQVMLQNSYFVGSCVTIKDSDSQLFPEKCILR